MIGTGLSIVFHLNFDRGNYFKVVRFINFLSFPCYSSFLVKYHCSHRIFHDGKSSFSFKTLINLYPNINLVSLYLIQAYYYVRFLLCTLYWSRLPPSNVKFAFRRKTYLCYYKLEVVLMQVSLSSTLPSSTSLYEPN